MSDFPHGWTATTLGEVGRYLNGRGFKKSEWSKVGRPIVRIQDLTGSGKGHNYFNGKVAEENLVRDGDLLISWAATIDAFIWRGPEGCVNQHIFKVESFIDRKFHYYAARAFANDLRRRTHGGGIVHVTRERFDSTPLLLPPLEEQTRIVEKLEELLSDLDAGIDALERARANLKRYRAAVLKAAVEGRLTEKWRAARPDFEPASKLLDRILAERRKKWEAAQLKKYVDKGQSPPKGWKDRYLEPVKPEVAGLPELPEGWCWATVDQCAWEVTVGHVGPMKERYEESGLPFLRSQNVRPFRFDRAGLKFISREFDSELSKSRLFGGEVLAVRSGNIGDACLYPEIEGLANCADLVITRLVARMNGSYVVAYLNSPIGRSRVLGKQTGSALPHFNVGAMSRSVIPLPPEREQDEIASNVAERLSQGEEAMREMERSSARSLLLRQAILKRAFEGRLVPQDPKDAPAAKLLAKIREARSAKQLNLVEKTKGRRRRQ